MRNGPFLPFALLFSVSAIAEPAPLVLPPFEVNASRVALETPVSGFAMPVTGLRFEPQVDVQARNFAESQADVSIRGGTFENTGFSLGAVPIYDPQTGHYFAELPVSPGMLGAPDIRTGAVNATAGWNATAGSVAYGWKPIRTGGQISAGAGDNHLLRGGLYAGYAQGPKLAGGTLAVDASVDYSESDGARAFGDHEFARYNARLQLAGGESQTDLFAGYQTKFFGWRNLYAGPFNSPETEDLQTTLVTLNHRVEYGGDGDYFQGGAYYRRNEDEYQFNRFAPTSAFIHRTHVWGAGFDGRISITDTTAIRHRAGAVADAIESTSLIVGPVNGRYNERTQVYVGAFLEQALGSIGQGEIELIAGGNYDDSNRDDSAVSPVVELAWEASVGMLRRTALSYSESTQLPTYTAMNSRSTGGLFGGNAALGRSTARNLELSVEAQAGGWEMRGAVFMRQDRELVDWVFGGPALPPPQPVRRAVAADLDTYGFELTTRRSWKRVDLTLGYTRLHKDEDFLTPGQSSFYAFNFPTHRLTAAIVARLGGGFELRSDNEARIQEENALRQGDDEVVLSSLGLYYAVPGIAGLTLSAQVDNLWDEDYQEVPLVPSTPREYVFGATYAW